MKNITQAQVMPRRIHPIALFISGLFLLALGLLLALTFGSQPANAHTESQPHSQMVQVRPILGAIDAVEYFGNGLTVITVDDHGGERLQLEARDELTIVVVPGQATSLARDLQAGSTIGALALQRIGVTNVNTASVAELQLLPQIGPARSQAIVNFRVSNGPFASVNDLSRVPGITASILDSIRGQVVVNDWLFAQQVMSKSSEARLYRHITGVVVDVLTTEVTILDGEGNRITLALPLGGASGISPGQPVTVSVKYDPKLDTYTAIDADRVKDALERLTDSLDLAQATGHAQNVLNLRLRLVDAIGRVNSALEQALARAPAVRQVVQACIGDLQTILRDYGLYGPVVTATGVVDLVDSSGGWIGFTTGAGQAIELKTEDDTVIRDGTQDIGLDQALFRA